MLRILKLLIILSSFAANVCNANTDLEWASNLSNSAVEQVWEHLSKQFNQQQELEGKEEYVLQPTSKLYVFVSSSMPIPLLKEYAHDALKYDATLVFKGLPNGSFKEFAELITQLKDNEGNIANVTIDDESFNRFDVSSVPTIILTQEPPYHPNQTPHVIFDKITGNTGVKYALEQFAQSGELQLASKYLERIKGD